MRTSAGGLRFVLHVVALSVLLMVRVSYAQPAPDEAPPGGPDAPAETTPPESPPPPPVDADADRKQQAKDRFLRGLELMRGENYGAALAEFLSSVETYPTRVAIENAAICYARLNRYTEAHAMYERLLRDFGAQLSAEVKQNAADAMARLQKNIGELIVESDQPQSTVIIDGAERGATPLSQPIRVDAGMHSVRVYKDGFIPFEGQVLVAGGQKKTVEAKLRALTQSGTLRVTEASGKQIDVVVDGAVVGKTPWSGALAVGPHSVALQGEGNLGSPPTIANIELNKVQSLTLVAEILDAQLRVEPTPSNARVHIDGVPVGQGIWEGRLKSGAHTVEVTANGFKAHSEEVQLRPNSPEVLEVRLNRDLSHPMWQEGFIPHLYAELFGGLALAGAMGGAASEACSEDACSDRSRPFGLLAGGRGGFEIIEGLGIELFVGYLSLKESITRTRTALYDLSSQSDLTSNDFEDTTTLAGPAAGLSLSYRFLEKTPVTVRLWAGAMRGNAEFTSEGTFQGTQTGPGGDDLVVRESLRFPEDASKFFVPFFGPEARVGYRFAKRFSVDIGVALLFVFPSETTRTRPDGQPRGAIESTDGSSLLESPGTFADGSAAAPWGIVELPNEAGFGTIVSIAPTIGARYDF